MALRCKDISEIEIAVLYYHVFGGCNDWKKLYQLADKANNETNEKTPNPSNVSVWKHSDKIQTQLKEINRRFALITAEYEEKGRNQEREKGVTYMGDNERTKTEKSKAVFALIDYTNPKAQADKLNELINTATDPNEALDALKVIIASQKADKESARDGKQVRVYTPLNCTDCPLYQALNAKQLKQSIK